MELITKYKQLHPTKWDDGLQGLREQLRAIGFYGFPIYEREAMIKEAKAAKGK